jgi:hypothetical protein
MRGALDATYIRSAVRLKLSTRAREMYACVDSGQRIADEQKSTQPQGG